MRLQNVDFDVPLPWPFIKMKHPKIIPKGHCPVDERSRFPPQTSINHLSIPPEHTLVCCWKNELEDWEVQRLNLALYPIPLNRNLILSKQPAQSFGYLLVLLWNLGHHPGTIPGATEMIPGCLGIFEDLWKCQAW